MEIHDCVAGQNASQLEISTFAVVLNVSGLAQTRDEIHGSASLAQNADTDWHNQIIASGRVRFDSRIVAHSLLLSA